MPKSVPVHQTPINTLNHKAPMPKFRAVVSLVNGDVIHVDDLTIAGVNALLLQLEALDIFSVELTRQ